MRRRSGRFGSADARTGGSGRSAFKSAARRVLRQPHGFIRYFPRTCDKRPIRILSFITGWASCSPPITTTRQRRCNPFEMKDIKTLKADSRVSLRLGVAHQVAVFDSRGRLIAHGRTCNLGPAGVFVVAAGPDAPLPGERVTLDMHLPVGGKEHTNRPSNRVVRYRSRVVHVQRLGRMFGLGIELLERLD